MSIKNSKLKKQNSAQLWGELSDLCTTTHEWLYAKKQPAEAGRLADRLEKALQSLPENDLAIIREEGWALLCELRGDFDDAISHRMREIELTQQLQEEAQSARYAQSTRDYMLQGRDADNLRERQAILESLRNAQ